MDDSDFDYDALLQEVRKLPSIKQPDKQTSTPSNQCQECCVQYTVSDRCYECPECHKVVDIDDDTLCSNIQTPKYKDALSGRMQVMGINSAKYQSDLDKNASNKSIGYQIRLIENELIKLNIEHERRGYKPIPLNVLHDVAVLYSDIQQKVVKRSTAKRKILAALLDRTYVTSEKSVKLTSDITAFAQLHGQGIAKGDDFVRSMHEQGILDIDINENRLLPHIHTIFNQLELHGEKYTKLQEAVKEIVERAIKKRIGNESVLRSKAVAATFNVLKRAETKITLNDIKSKCKIRVYTIKRFLDELTRKHKSFIKIYEKYKLNQEILVDWMSM